MTENNTYVKLAEQTLDNFSINYTTQSIEDITEFTFTMETLAGRIIDVRMYADNDGEFLIKAYCAEDIPRSCRTKAISIANGLNLKYRKLKFRINRSNEFEAVSKIKIFEDDKRSKMSLAVTLLSIKKAADEVIEKVKPMLE